MDNIFFNAHHPPIGAYASLTFGSKGSKGGLDLELGKPADENIFIGLETREPGVFRTLPFYDVVSDERSRYSVGTVNADYICSARIDMFPDDVISRDFRPATDTWSAPDLTFRVYSHAFSIPNPETASPEDLRRALLPAVQVEITVDNTECDSGRRAFFGYQVSDLHSSMRNFGREGEDSVYGIGDGVTKAIACRDKDVWAGQGFIPEEIIAPRQLENLAFGLGSVGMLVMTAAPGERRTWRFAVCFYRDGVVTTGIRARYMYQRWFSRIEEVAEFALENFDFYKDMAETMDRSFDAGHLSADQKFMMAHSIRSYYANTELLESVERPIWIVNEGNYRLMNTLDLTVDQVFYELRTNPWTVRNVLDLYLERYSYRDFARLPGDSTEHPGGLGFTHDMGRGNNFSQSGRSAYELSGIKGCFSYMTCEELVNWTLCAAMYYGSTCDNEWLSSHTGVLSECLASLVNRDHPSPEMHDGVMDLDSGRTMGGAEITTYDSLDTSLGRARRSLYLAVKTWAAYVVLERVFDAHGNRDLGWRSGEQADRCAETIAASLTEEGFIPAVLGTEHHSRIIPAIEGLVFPYFAGCAEALDAGGRFGKLMHALRMHLSTVLCHGSCLFPDGGWKLSSSSENSWLSKIYLCQFVARQILGMHWGPEGRAADRAHVQWLLHPDSSYWCWSDQMISGKAWGSLYYPRGVTSILWLYEGRGSR